MKRTGFLTVLMAVAVIAGILAWNGLRQDREFRRLIAQGDAALAVGQTFAAVEAFSDALALKPDSMLAYLKRGDARRHRAEFDAALGDLHRAASLDPSATRPRELLGDVNVALGRYGDAIDDYGAALAIDERSPEVLYKQGLARLRNEEPALAVAPLRAALVLDERFTEAHYALALCLPAAAAIRELERALELNPTFLPAIEELARVLTMQGRTREAVATWETLDRLEPGNGERAISVGLALARAGRPEAAMASLTRAVERFPSHAGVHAALNRVSLEVAAKTSDSGLLARVREDLRRTANAPGATSEAFGLYGRALLHSGDVESAERLLLQARAKLPIEPAYLLDLATASEQLGHLDTARRALLDYVALLPESAPPMLLLQIATLFLRLDDTERALSWAKRAAASPGGSDAARAVLAEALTRAAPPEATDPAITDPGDQASTP